MTSAGTAPRSATYPSTRNCSTCGPVSIESPLPGDPHLLHPLLQRRNDLRVEFAAGRVPARETVLEGCRLAKAMIGAIERGGSREDGLDEHACPRSAAMRINSPTPSRSSETNGSTSRIP